MKKITLTLAFFILSINLFAAKTVPGPRGGRLLEHESQRAEFLMESDRTVTIKFYDAHLKPIPLLTQSVTLIAETKNGKKTIEFEKKGDLLVSKAPLPEGNHYHIVVQLKSSADAKPKNHRIVLNTEKCGGCNLAEYACICGH